MIALAVLTTLVGCSIYPVPDDVALLKTEQIVLHGRCEMRAAVMERITHDKVRLREIFETPAIEQRVVKWFKAKNITPATATRDASIVALVHAIGGIVEEQQEINRQEYNRLRYATKSPRDQTIKLKELQKKLSKQLDAKLGRARELTQYLDAAAVYDFEFEITEQNHTKGELAFRLPLASKTVDADASAALLLTRKGKRTFKTQDRWGKLLTSEKLCNAYEARSNNVVYPLGGSIGVDRVASTFINLIDQGGSKDSFVDALVFTTDVSGGVNGAIKLTPVPDAFRLISAGGHLYGSRVDVHKLTLSLVFPKQESSEAIFGADRFDGNLDEPFERPADWRARYNLCVADARGREDALKALRLTAPEIYCIQYADAFDSQYGQPARREIEVAIRVDTDGKAKASGSTGTRSAPLPAAPARRPNFIPY